MPTLKTGMKPSKSCPKKAGEKPCLTKRGSPRNLGQNGADFGGLDCARGNEPYGARRGHRAAIRYWCVCGVCGSLDRMLLLSGYLVPGANMKYEAV